VDATVSIHNPRTALSALSKYVSKYVQKALISRETVGYLSTQELTQVIE